MGLSTDGYFFDELIDNGWTHELIKKHLGTYDYDDLENSGEKVWSSNIVNLAMSNIKEVHDHFQSINDGDEEFVEPHFDDLSSSEIYEHLESLLIEDRDLIPYIGKFFCAGMSWYVLIKVKENCKEYYIRDNEYIGENGFVLVFKQNKQIIYKKINKLYKEIGKHIILDCSSEDISLEEIPKNV